MGVVMAQTATGRPEAAERPLGGQEQGDVGVVMAQFGPPPPRLVS